MPYAHGFQQRALGRTAGRGDHFCAKMMRNLDCRHAHAARACMDEDALARLKMRHRFQRMP